MELVTTANNTYSANDFAHGVARLVNKTALVSSAWHNGQTTTAERTPLFIYLPFQSVKFSQSNSCQRGVVVNVSKMMV